MCSFRAFECDQVGEVAYLKADYSVVCASSGDSAQSRRSDHAIIQAVAVIAILLYPVGVRVRREFEHTVLNKRWRRLASLQIPRVTQIPVAYARLLYQVRTEVLRSEHSPLSSALHFLHGPFKPVYFWWELVLVAQKLLIVGFLVLEPFQPGSFIQLMLGLSVAFTFTVVQKQVQPYLSRQDNILATICGVSVFSFFLGAVLYRFHELTSDFDAVSAQLTSSWASKRFTLSPGLISILMIASLFGSVVTMILLQCLELFTPDHAEIFRWKLDGSQVVPPLLAADQFHCFLSHSTPRELSPPANAESRSRTADARPTCVADWATGQDQARTIKAQFASLCPGLRVWLGEHSLDTQYCRVCKQSPCPLDNALALAIDVDNMRSKAGTSSTDKASFEKLIDGVQVMVAILTGSISDGEELSDYFKSVPCQHELSRAQENGTPIVYVLESARVPDADPHTRTQAPGPSLTPETNASADSVHFRRSRRAARRYFVGCTPAGLPTTPAPGV